MNTLYLFSVYVAAITGYDGYNLWSNLLTYNKIYIPMLVLLWIIFWVMISTVLFAIIQPLFILVPSNNVDKYIQVMIAIIYNNPHQIATIDRKYANIVRCHILYTCIACSIRLYIRYISK